MTQLNHLNIASGLVIAAMESDHLRDALCLAIMIKTKYVSSVYKKAKGYKTWEKQIARDLDCCLPVAKRVLKNAKQKGLVYEDCNGNLRARSLQKGYSESISVKGKKGTYNCVRIDRIVMPKLSVSEISIKAIVKYLRKSLIVRKIRRATFKKNSYYSSNMQEGKKKYESILTVQPSNEEGMIKMSHKIFADTIKASVGTVANIMKELINEGVVEKQTYALECIGYASDANHYEGSRDVIFRYGKAFLSPFCIYRVVERKESPFSTGSLILNHKGRRIRLDMSSNRISNRQMCKAGLINSIYDL